MKVTDLMVGDWVICNHYQDKPFIKQFGVADFAKGEYEFCEPILITAKILEKNGFEYYSDDAWVLSWAHDFVLVCEVGGIRYNSRIKVKYVHQLQHLLRLCGVEKELVID